MILLDVEVFYGVIGAVFAFVAVQVARDRGHARRWGTAAFWGLLGAVYVFGRVLPPVAVGYAVVALVALAALRQVARAPERTSSPEERRAAADRLGNRLFRPALLVPAIAIVGTLTLGHVRWGDVALVDPQQVTLVALGLGAIVATLAAWRLTGDPASVPLSEGSRLLQAVGWALVLPQLLAALGGIFGQAGVDREVAALVSDYLPVSQPFVAVAAYCVGMAVFTMCLGNAFAAFAAITGGVGLPFVVQLHHGNPAIMGAVGMLSGYCGTLLTPMAANFNLVPAMLLELKDRNAVIRAQVPIGLAILAANILIMAATVYRF